VIRIVLESSKICFKKYRYLFSFWKPVTILFGSTHSVHQIIIMWCHSGK